MTKVQSTRFQGSIIQSTSSTDIPIWMRSNCSSTVKERKRLARGTVIVAATARMVVQMIQFFMGRIVARRYLVPPPIGAGCSAGGVDIGIGPGGGLLGEVDAGRRSEAGGGSEVVGPEPGAGRAGAPPGSGA